MHPDLIKVFDESRAARNQAEKENAEEEEAWEGRGGRGGRGGAGAVEEQKLQRKQGKEEPQLEPQLEPQQDSHEDAQWTVKAIIDKRREKGILKYKVEWEPELNEVTPIPPRHTPAAIPPPPYPRHTPPPTPPAIPPANAPRHTPPPYAPCLAPNRPSSPPLAPYAPDPPTPTQDGSVRQTWKPSWEPDYNVHPDLIESFEEAEAARKEAERARKDAELERQHSEKVLHLFGDAI